MGSLLNLVLCYRRRDILRAAARLQWRSSLAARWNSSRISRLPPSSRVDTAVLRLVRHSLNHEALCVLPDQSNAATGECSRETASYPMPDRARPSDELSFDTQPSVSVWRHMPANQAP